MPPRNPSPRSDELSRSQLDNMIDMEHTLVKLAGPARTRHRPQNCSNEELEAPFAIARERVARLLAQKADDADKLYALRERNHLAGVTWDAINAIPVAAGYICGCSPPERRTPRERRRHSEWAHSTRPRNQNRIVYGGLRSGRRLCITQIEIRQKIGQTTGVNIHDYLAMSANRFDCVCKHKFFWAAGSFCSIPGIYSVIPHLVVNKPMFRPTIGATSVLCQPGSAGYRKIRPCRFGGRAQKY